MGRPIVISVLGDTKGLDRSLGQSESRLGRFGSTAGRVGSTVAKGVGIAGVAIAAGVAKWGIDSVKSLARIERLNAQTASVIKSTGGAANVSSKHIQDLTGHLENVTATEAESIQEGANLLLTFTNIQNKVGKGNAIFDRATTTITDMSRALGQDTKSSALQLGKALNDPIKGVTALQRVGVSFTQGQKDQITTLVKSGKTLQAQKLILGELNKEFGGAGKAYAATTAGKLALVGHAFGTLGETIFAKFLPPLADGATFLAKFLNDLASGSGQVGSISSKISAKLGPAFASVQPVLKSLGALFVGTILPAAQRLGTYVVGTFGPVLASIGQVLLTKVVPTVLQFGQFLVGTLYPAVFKIAVQVGQNLKPVFDQLSQSIQTQVVPAISALWTRIQAALPTIEATALVVAKVTGKVLVFSAAVLGKVLPVVIRLAAVLIGSAVRAIGVTITAVSKIIGFLGRFGSATGSAVRAVVSFAGRVVSTVASLPGKIIGAMGRAGTLLLQKGKDVIGGLITGIGNKIGDLVGKGGLGKVKSKVQGAIDNPLGWLKGAGEKVIQGLIDGITSKLGDVGHAMGKIASKVKGFLPGSPVKEGPLRSWNNGGAGKRLVDLLAYGIDNTQSARNAAQRLAADVAGQVKVGASRPTFQAGGGPVRRGGGVAGVGAGIVINVTLEVPVGANGADIGRTLVEYIEDYYDVGGKRL